MHIALLIDENWWKQLLIRSNIIKSFLTPLIGQQKQFMRIRILSRRMKIKLISKWLKGWESLLAHITGSPGLGQSNGFDFFFSSFCWLCLSTGAITEKDCAVWGYGTTVFRGRYWTSCSIIPSKSPSAYSRSDRLGILTVPGLNSKDPLIPGAGPWVEVVNFFQNTCFVGI